MTWNMMGLSRDEVDLIASDSIASHSALKVITPSTILSKRADLAMAWALPSWWYKSCTLYSGPSETIFRTTSLSRSSEERQPPKIFSMADRRREEKHTRDRRGLAQSVFLDTSSLALLDLRDVPTLEIEDRASEERLMKCFTLIDSKIDG